MSQHFRRNGHSSPLRLDSRRDKVFPSLPLRPAVPSFVEQVSLRGAPGGRCVDVRDNWSLCSRPSVQSVSLELATLPASGKGRTRVADFIRAALCRFGAEEKASRVSFHCDGCLVDHTRATFKTRMFSAQTALFPVAAFSRCIAVSKVHTTGEIRGDFRSHQAEYEGAEHNSTKTLQRQENLSSAAQTGGCGVAPHTGGSTLNLSFSF